MTTPSQCTYEKASEPGFSGIVDACGDMSATVPCIEEPKRVGLVVPNNNTHTPSTFYVEKRGRLVFKVGAYTGSPANYVPAAGSTQATPAVTGTTRTIELVFIVRNTHGRTVLDLTEATDYLFACFEKLVGTPTFAPRHNILEWFEANKATAPAFRVRVVNDSKFPAYVVVGPNGTVQSVSRSVGVARGETLTLLTRPSFPRVEWLVTERA